MNTPLSNFNYFTNDYAEDKFLSENNENKNHPKVRICPFFIIDISLFVKKF